MRPFFWLFPQGSRLHLGSDLSGCHQIGFKADPLVATLNLADADCWRCRARR